jgi:type VI secretion system protein ImpB
LTRVRPPRVKITYDVEIGSAIEKKELPFILGVLADLSGQPAEPLPLKARKFVEIDRDNFDAVLKAIAPRLDIKVKNHLNGAEGGDVSIPLSFTKIDDFRPESLVQQVTALSELLEKRNKLRDLLTKSDGNDKWAALIDRTVGQNASVQKALPPPTDPAA